MQSPLGLEDQAVSGREFVGELGRHRLDRGHHGQVQIDGAGTPLEMRAFARLTRVPPGLREAYVRFAMRTIVGVAPGAAVLVELFDDVGLASPSVEKVAGLPFLVLQAAVV